MFITGIKPRDSCQYYFKSLRILLLQSQYLYSILTSVANNIHLYETCADVHGSNIRQNADFYQPSTRPSISQTGTFHIGIKIFISLPSEIKDLIHNVIQLKNDSKFFFYLNSFYTIQGYYDYNKHR
jgi:hypothetical protein